MRAGSRERSSQEHPLRGSDAFQPCPQKPHASSCRQPCCSTLCSTHGSVSKVDSGMVHCTSSALRMSQFSSLQLRGGLCTPLTTLLSVPRPSVSQAKLYARRHRSQHGQLAFSGMDGRALRSRASATSVTAACQAWDTQTARPTPMPSYNAPLSSSSMRRDNLLRIIRRHSLGKSSNCVSSGSSLDDASVATSVT